MSRPCQGEDIGDECSTVPYSWQGNNGKETTWQLEWSFTRGLSATRKNVGTNCSDCYHTMDKASIQQHRPRA